MIPIEWSSYPFKMKDSGDKRLIFDEIRQKWIVLTPEEWVRQNLVMYLIHQKAYPKHLIAVEKAILFNNKKKRFDLVIYNRDLKPWMLIECKEPNVPINEQTLFQLLTYQATLQCKYWLMSNGKATFCATYNTALQIEWLQELPTFE